MLLRSLHLENILSFGPDGVDLEMRPLNVLIGPNGSGKSNLIEIISLLAAAPRDIQEPLRTGGGLREWTWKGPTSGAPTVSADVALAQAGVASQVQYRLALRASVTSFGPADIIERVAVEDSVVSPAFVFRCEDGKLVLAINNEESIEIGLNLRTGQSVLAHVGLPFGTIGLPPPPSGMTLSALGEALQQIRLFREWTFGRRSGVRLPQATDERLDFLLEGGANLGLVLQRMRLFPEAKERLIEQLRRFYDGISDYVVDVAANSVQVFLQEGSRTIPATRLSDGTLRYLCLLAILCHPEPPPLVCIEEPELGLHPDILPGLADLLRDASQRMQLVVTTHSDVLVDALTDTPESIVICEKDERGTHLRRLDKEQLKPWLETYRLGLGELWISGELGGKRW